VRRKRYHPKAEIEIIEAASYLERQRPEYGEKFLDEIDEAIESLLKDPFVWNIQFRVYRKYTTSQFKYQIWYRVTDDEVYIFAVAHPSRRPGYWRKRISDEQR
jgi:toxin ParE1/3/4